MADLRTLTESTLRFINHGARPGSFTAAVLCNDLFEAVGRSDETSHLHLRELCRFIYNEAPMNCWGSPEKVQAWIDARGLSGKGLPLLPDDQKAIWKYSLDMRSREALKNLPEELQEMMVKSWLGASEEVSDEEVL